MTSCICLLCQDQTVNLREERTKEYADYAVLVSLVYFSDIQK